MRFTLFSLALLALAHSVAPGVHGAPAIVSDHVNSLVARQGPVSVISGLLDSLSSLVNTLLGGGTPSPQLLQTIQQVGQELQSVLQGAASRIPRALPSSSGAAPSTTSTFLPAATAGNASNGSLDISQASPTTSSLARMRRQSPPSHSASTPSVPSSAGSQSALQPSQSVLQILPSVLSVVSSKVGTLRSAVSQPTGHH